MGLLAICYVTLFKPASRGRTLDQMADIASDVPERLGCCHGPAEARGRYARWAQKHLHRAGLREHVYITHHIT